GILFVAITADRFHVVDHTPAEDKQNASFPRNHVAPDPLVRPRSALEFPLERRLLLSSLSPDGPRAARFASRDSPRRCPYGSRQELRSVAFVAGSLPGDQLADGG